MEEKVCSFLFAKLKCEKISIYVQGKKFYMVFILHIINEIKPPGTESNITEEVAHSPKRDT